MKKIINNIVVLWLALGLSFGAHAGGFSAPPALTQSTADAVYLKIDGTNKGVSGDTLLPTGAMIDFAGTVAPSGFLCSIAASNVSRALYSKLYAVIGTTWGAGDGSTFGLPYVLPNQVGVQASANVGTATVGQVISHTHRTQYSGAAGGGTTTLSGGNIENTGAFNDPVQATGGAYNLPAGVRVMKCIKY
jgi:microcystin-dependent protein